MARLKKVLLWVVTILLGFVFLMTGTNKLGGHPSMAEKFADWGYAPWFLLVIGVIEVGGAIALVIPRIARFGGYALVPVMLGAAVTHVRAGEWPNPLFNLLFATGLFWIARSRTARP